MNIKSELIRQYNTIIVQAAAMKVSPTQELINQTSQYTLSGFIDSQASRIVLNLTTNYNEGQRNSYCATIESLQRYPLLSNYFNELADVMDYIKQPQNIRVDLKELTMVIQMRMPVKKNSIIELATIQFHQPDKSKSQIISDIIQRCTQNTVLNDNEIKNIIKQLAHCTLLVLNTKQNQQQNKQSVKIATEQTQQKIKQVNSSGNTQQPHELKQNLQLQNYSQQIKQIKNNINQFKINIKNQITVFQENIQNKCNQEIEILTNAIQNQVKKLQKALSKVQLAQNCQNKNLNKIFNLKDQANADKFRIQNFKIQYIQEKDNYWTQYIFNEVVPMQGEYRYKVKIVKTARRCIMIGLIDYEARKNQLYSFTSDFAVSYYGHDTRKFPSGGYEGTGFKEGQVVEIRANRSNRTIQWWVDDRKMATHQLQILGDCTRTFMPYVQMVDKFDTVQWLSE